MTVGLFGGSFDPPHLAHLIVAEAVREACGLAQVLWMPAAQPPHKPDRRLAAAADRLAMVRLATADHPAFAVSDLEVARAGTSFTVDTLRQLQDENPETDYALIIGGDSLADFHTWHRPDEIAERVPLLVYPRPGRPTDVPDAPWADRVHLASAPLLDLSSTAIRARVRAGRSIRYLVPEPVRAYIEANGLYRG